jgi:hypothetical protein
MAFCLLQQSFDSISSGFLFPINMLRLRISVPALEVRPDEVSFSHNRNRRTLKIVETISTTTFIL